MSYEVCVTAVSDRGDLFVQSMDSLLQCVDVLPERILVHEDVRNGHWFNHIEQWISHCPIEILHKTSDIPAGMGLGMLWLLENAKTPLILYTQEDWLFLRKVPVRRTMELMNAYGLHHVRWNKRKTMPCKHEDKPHMRWDKVEVVFDGQVMCISDHWYTQSSMWRVSEALPAVREVAPYYPQAHEFVARLNDWINRNKIGKHKWADQQLRHQHVKTYIWGGIGEPAFVKHIGSLRGTGVIKNHLTEL